MSLYSDPPPHRLFSEDKPTLLVCWWCTIFACVIIIFRVCGRYVRSEELFLEDKIAFACNIPILIRMALVHVVILFGTNNTEVNELGMGEREVWRREVGSRLVLLSRVFYAASLWMCKFAIIFYLKRITDNIYKSGYSLLVKLTYWFLGITFLASFVSTFAECQPFNNYWQVLPTPEGSCRQGFVQLIATAVGNVLSDLILVVLPLPIVWSSKLGRGKQVQISCLFCLSLVPVSITLYRIPAIIQSHGAQAQRSLWASLEILFATSAANALVLGTFMRDRGTKKNKYKFGSGDQSTVERRRSTLRTRDTNLHKRWGSDEDLVRELGLSVSRGMWEEDLTEEGEQPDLPQHPPAVAKFGDKNGMGPYSNHGFGGSSRSLGLKHGKGQGVTKHWRFPARQPGTRSHGENISEETESIIASASQTGLSSNPHSPEPHDMNSPATLASARSEGHGASSKMTFFDVGNLLHADDVHERSERGRGPQDSHPGNAITVSQQLQSHHHRRKSSLLAAGFGTTTVISAGPPAQPEPYNGYTSHSTSNSRSNTGLSPAPLNQNGSAKSEGAYSAQPVLQRSATMPFSQAAAYEPGSVSCPRKGSAVFLQDVGGLLDGGPPISVSAAETQVISPLNLNANDPLGTKNAEAAAKEVLGYWDREKPPPPLPPLDDGRGMLGSPGPSFLAAGEGVELQNLESPAHVRRPGAGVIQRSRSGKSRGQSSHSASKSGFSFVTSGIGRGRGRTKEREGAPAANGEGASPVMPPRLQSGRRDGGEEAAMEFVDVGGLLK